MPFIDVFPLAAGAGATFLQSPLPLMLIIFGIFYFLVIRPQQALKRKTREMLQNLKTGDKVITNGGMYGTIADFRESAVILEVAPQVKIEVTRTSIQSLQPSRTKGATG